MFCNELKPLTHHIGALFAGLTAPFWKRSICSANRSFCLSDIYIGYICNMLICGGVIDSKSLTRGCFCPLTMNKGILFEERGVFEVMANVNFWHDGFSQYASWIKQCTFLILSLK